MVAPHDDGGTVNRLMHPIDGLWLVMFRVGLGTCLIWQIWWYFSTDLIYTYYVEPQHHFTWFGLDFVQPWPGDGMYVHFFVLGVAALCVLLGFYYRIAAAVFCIGFAHVFLIDTCWYLNHYYLICLLSFLAIFLPANRELSLDSLWRPERHCQTVPAWSLWLLRFQLAIPYFYGGVAKINADWLFGEPIRTWLRQRNDFPLLGRFFEEEWCVFLFVYGGMIFDLLVVPLLLWRRTRIPAMMLVIVFHLTNSRLFDIGVFPWLMMWATLTVFSSPNAIGRLRFWRQPTEPRGFRPTWGTSQKLVAGLLVCYVTWQVLLPLRHFLYPGNTAFTREGHYFSWRMKLNIRRVEAAFVATDTETQDAHAMPLSKWITLTQERKLRDADQLLQLAQWMVQDARRHGQQIPRITTSTTVALNGRPPTAYVDPQLDLATIPRSFAPADWITLYPEPRYLSDMPSKPVAP